MRELIVSPFLDSYLILRRGSTRGIKIPQQRYLALCEISANDACPAWLVGAVEQRWALDISESPIGEVCLIREPGRLDFARASYELNLGCNYDCEHCYLGLKKFAGMTWPDRERVLHIMRDAGCCGCN